MFLSARGAPRALGSGPRGRIPVVQLSRERRARARGRRALRPLARAPARHGAHALAPLRRERHPRRHRPRARDAPRARAGSRPATSRRSCAPPASSSPTAEQVALARRRRGRRAPRLSAGRQGGRARAPAQERRRRRHPRPRVAGRGGAPRSRRCASACTRSATRLEGVLLQREVARRHRGAGRRHDRSDLRPARRVRPRRRARRAAARRRVPPAAGHATSTPREMLDRLRAARLLDGYRGAPPGDRAALADVIPRVSALVEVVPELRELDLNPVKVLAPGQGAVVVDAPHAPRPAAVLTVALRRARRAAPAPRPRARSSLPGGSRRAPGSCARATRPAPAARG